MNAYLLLAMQEFEKALTIFDTIYNSSYVLKLDLEDLLVFDKSVSYIHCYMDDVFAFHYNNFVSNLLYHYQTDNHIEYGPFEIRFYDENLNHHKQRFQTAITNIIQSLIENNFSKPSSDLSGYFTISMKKGSLICNLEIDLEYALVSFDFVDDAGVKHTLRYSGRDETLSVSLFYGSIVRHGLADVSEFNAALIFFKNKLLNHKGGNK